MSLIGLSLEFLRIAISSLSLLPEIKFSVVDLWHESPSSTAQEWRGVTKSDCLGDLKRERLNRVKL